MEVYYIVGKRSWLIYSTMKSQLTMKMYSDLRVLCCWAVYCTQSINNHCYTRGRKHNTKYIRESKKTQSWSKQIVKIAVYREIFLS